MRPQLEAVEAAATNLSFAASAFKRAAEEMRDLQGEEEADLGQQQAKKADAALGLAMQDRPTA